MQDSTVNNEKDLLAKVATGDEEAFAKLVKQYHNSVFSHALTYIKSYHESEELVQDIFLKVWNARLQLREIKDFKSFLFILGRNQLISHIRKNITRTENDFPDLPEASLKPDEQYQSKEIYQKILEGVERLSPQQKSVFVMSRFEHLTHDEISERLGISKRTVKFHLVIALNHLRIYLAKLDYSTILLPAILFLHEAEKYFSGTLPFC